MTSKKDLILRGFIPPSAQLVHAYGEPTEISLSDEVVDIPSERRAAFVVELVELQERERDEKARSMGIRL